MSYADHQRALRLLGAHATALPRARAMGMAYWQEQLDKPPFLKPSDDPDEVQRLLREMEEP